MWLRADKAARLIIDSRSTIKIGVRELFANLVLKYSFSIESDGRNGVLNLRLIIVELPDSLSISICALEASWNLHEVAVVHILAGVYEQRLYLVKILSSEDDCLVESVTCTNKQRLVFVLCQLQITKPGAGNPELITWRSYLWLI